MNSQFTLEQKKFASSVETIARFLSKNKEIDWEQRRYEIAKEYFIRYPREGADTAVCRADQLITFLKMNDMDSGELTYENIIQALQEIGI